MGQRGRQAVAAQYSKESLLGGLVEVIEGVL